MLQNAKLNEVEKTTCLQPSADKNVWLSWCLVYVWIVVISQSQSLLMHQ